MRFLSMQFDEEKIEPGKIGLDHMNRLDCQIPSLMSVFYNLALKMLGLGQRILEFYNIYFQDSMFTQKKIIKLIEKIDVTMADINNDQELINRRIDNFIKRCQACRAAGGHQFEMKLHKSRKKLMFDKNSVS